MENQFEKVIDIIIAVIIFFVFPVMYFTQRQETLIEQVVSTETSEFINTVNSHGKLTKAMYEDYIAKLDDTNVICNVKMEHKKLALEPEYRLRTAQEIIDEQDKAYIGSNIYHYFPVSSELPVVNDNTDNNGLVMNTETNESILAKAVRTAADPSHSHTEGCYVGAHKHGTNVLIENHVHNDSCYCPGHIHLHSYSGPHSGGVTAICDVCGHYYNPGEVTEGQRCTQLVCGFENGTYCNCYSPTIDVEFYHNGPIVLKCHECGKTMYTIDPPEYGTVRVEVGGSSYVNTVLNVPCGDCNDPNSVYWDYNKISDYLNTLPYISSGSSAYDVKQIPAGKFTFRIPGIGYFKECPICNDYIAVQNRSYAYNNSGTVDLYCMKCHQLIARATPDYNKGYVVYLYKNGTVAQQIDYGNSIPSGSLYEALYKLCYNNGAYSADKYYHEDGFQGQSTWGWSYSDAFTTVSSDCSVINMFPLSSYTHHGCTHNAGKNTFCGLEGELKCHDIVKSITPTNPVQTVYVGEPLITTATATYMDGSTGVVLCNADFTAATPVKNKTVTLSYVNINRQTLTCTETVTVIPKTKVCIYGHTYNLNADGTDPGCPYCRAWLKGLEIFNPTDGKITIYRGTTLKENGVVLLATYFDGRKEYVENAYIDNLDKYYVGTQNVTISYKGKDVNLIVTTKRNIVQCPVCYHYYELYPDDTDPGCPYCKARTPVFTGNVLKYYSETYSEEILKKLYEESETYCFRAGDYFSVSVTNKSETLGTKLLGFVIHGVPRTSIYVEKGGTVGEDAYGEHER